MAEDKKSSIDSMITLLARYQWHAAIAGLVILNIITFSLLLAESSTSPIPPSPGAAQITTTISYQVYRDLQKRIDTIQEDYNKLNAQKNPPAAAPSVPKTEYDAMVKERNTLLTQLANTRVNSSDQVDKLLNDLAELRRKYADLRNSVASRNITAGGD